jgi:glycine C-acetyltransferase
MAYNKAKKFYGDTLQEIRNNGLFKDEYILTSPQGAWINVQFPEGAPEKKVLCLCANNYLGLSSHPDIIKAAHEGLDKRGYGMSSVRFIVGTQDIHRELERKMSEFLGTEDTILFGSCFDANGAVFEALLGEEDAIFSDALVHASIIDGERLAKKVPRSIYPHSDMAELEKLLKEDSEKEKPARFKMIITDGVFSMDGDMAKLDEIVVLAEKYDAMVFVDDSHATGFIGKTGRGTHEYFDVMKKVDLITTTFGKALGGASGGCVSGRKEIVDMLRQRGRPYLFSNAVPPVVVSGTLKVLEILSKDTTRRDKLADLSIFWRDGLTKAGFALKPGNTPIIPIMLYDAKLAQDFARELFEEGVYVRGFFYPVVAQGQARIRTQMSAGLEKVDLEKALKAFVKVGKKLGVLKA